MRATTIAQAARFTEACALWVPLYRQVTIGTYLQSKDILERGLAVAFADVERAFAEYLAHADPSRKVVVVGHSQGAEMVNRLLRRFFDDDAALRTRLLLALPIGGDVDTLAGSSRGGTAKNIPVCTRPDETGCIVAYRTYAAGERVVPDRWATPFVILRDFYAARCVREPGGYAWLEVSPVAAAHDARKSPVDLHDRRFRIGNLGLHILDLQLAQGDLVDMIARRASMDSPSR